ncbi:MAG TPA: heme ABC transporter permease [Gammaproteobacteria bacterium]|nr:heme ABC transporter permease [Gammaproteobacteria bacterium]
MWKWFHQLASPPHYYRMAGAIIPWTGWPALLLIIIGAVGGLYLAPPDYQQGDAFRIIYVHVPSAWLSMFGYVVMATAAAIGLIWRMKLAHVAANAVAPLGASFTALALATGSIWGRPMWGTWWVWDARLTSELILLFLYFGYMALNRAFEDRKQGDRASAVLALVGVVNVPIIHYSVEWWNTLHQPATITKFGKPSITVDMLWPLLVMFLGFTLFFITVALQRARAETLERERRSAWVKEL